MGHRDAGGGRCRERRADPGHHLDVDPGRRSASASSPPRPNTNGSPPFSRTTRRPDRPWSMSCVDVRLAARLPGPLAHVDQLRARGRQVEQLAGDQPVVDDHVGPASSSAPRRVSRPGSPGPAPTRATVIGHLARHRPGLAVRPPLAEVVPAGVVEQVAGHGPSERRGRPRSAVAEHDVAVPRPPCRPAGWSPAGSVGRGRRLGMGTDRQRAAAAQLGQERPLGLDHPPDRGVVDGRQRPAGVVVVGPALDGQGTLGHLGHHRRRLERLDLQALRGGPRQPVEGGPGHHHRGHRAVPVPPSPPWPAGWPGCPGGRRTSGRVGGWPAAPAAGPSRWPPWPRPGASRRAPTSTSRGSPRSGKAASTRPGTASSAEAGRSLAECTAASASPGPPPPGPP